MKAKYFSGSGDMEAAIRKIIETNCCLLTVVFGQSEDLKSLFLEAYRQRYPGEWIVVNQTSLENLARDLEAEISSARDLQAQVASVNDLLQGM